MFHETVRHWNLWTRYYNSRKLESLSNFGTVLKKTNPFYIFTGCYKNNNVLKPRVADIGFAVDASSSLYSQGFQTEISFINKVIDAVGPVSKDGVRISVLVYSNMAKLRIRFADLLFSYIIVKMVFSSFDTY